MLSRPSSSLLKIKRLHSSTRISPRLRRRLRKPSNPQDPIPNSLRTILYPKPPSQPSQFKSTRMMGLAVLMLVMASTAGILFKTFRPSQQQVLPVSPPVSADLDQGLVYNVKQPPNLAYSEKLQTIVDETVQLAQNQGLSSESLSITLIDVSNSTQHTFAGHNHTLIRFPASVSKLFWLVAFLAAVETQTIPDEAAFYRDLSQMMRISDNSSASRVLDATTATTSGDKLEGEAWESWAEKRSQVNHFFREAGYKNIKLTTKNYPIPDLHEEPTGRDLQLKENGLVGGGNRLSTDHAARLMYEIYTKQAVSPIASTKIAYLLTRDLNPEAWQDEVANSVEGFLSESLPTNLYFGSKVGYTSYSRQEVAFVRTLDDKAIYILAIFGNDRAYAQDEEIFPKMSRYIFDQLRSQKK